MNTNNIENCYFVQHPFMQWGFPVYPYIPVWIVPMFVCPTLPYVMPQYTEYITTGTKIISQPNNQSK